MADAVAGPGTGVGNGARARAGTRTGAEVVTVAWSGERVRAGIGTDPTVELKPASGPVAAASGVAPGAVLTQTSGASSALGVLLMLVLLLLLLL